MSQPQSSNWVTWAIGSGAFAAANGVFAKLTTAQVTQTIATSVSRWLGFGTESTVVELCTRAAFFGLNLLSNAVMWILFTRALTAASSTTKVSVLNTAANFLVTAFLGLLVFGENLPLGWWLGAMLLMGGSLVIGARDNDVPGKSEPVAALALDPTANAEAYRDDTVEHSPTSSESSEAAADLRR